MPSFSTTDRDAEWVARDVVTFEGCHERLDGWLTDVRCSVVFMFYDRAGASPIRSYSSSGICA